MSRKSLFFILPLIVSCSTLHGAPYKPAASKLKLKPLDVYKIEKAKAKVEAKAATPAKAPKKKMAKAYKYTLVPKRLRPQTKKWVRYYSKKDRKRFQRFLNRGAQYKSFIQAMLSEYKLPPELYYLGILESGYSTSAVSHAGAVGAWQFMGPTGKEYGLSINNYVDERLDPVRSTVAAIKYLKELRRQTRDWKLALAAYNAGPGRVRRAIRRGGRNFWNLHRRRLLPRDTRNYIPQFLAMVHIAQNLKRYGFQEKPGEYHKDIHLVTVPSPVRLKDISHVTKLPVAKIRKMNPHLKKDVTPPHLKTYDIWIPKAHALSLISKKPTLARKVVKGLKVRQLYTRRRRARYHRVRRGDTLIGIARRYGKRVGDLRRRNRLRRSGMIRIGQKLRLTGGRAVARRPKKYRIRRGDNLTTIARKFNTTVKRLRALNKIRGNRILKGQTILIAKN